MMKRKPKTMDDNLTQQQLDELAQEVETHGEAIGTAIPHSENPAVASGIVSGTPGDSNDIPADTDPGPVPGFYDQETGEAVPPEQGPVLVVLQMLPDVGIAIQVHGMSNTEAIAIMEIAKYQLISEGIQGSHHGSSMEECAQKFEAATGIAPGEGETTG
jgi:hypothetical protein